MESDDTCDATPEQAITFSAMPFEVLTSIAASIMPTNGFAAEAREWHDLVHTIATCNLMHVAALEQIMADAQGTGLEVVVAEARVVAISMMGLLVDYYRVGHRRR